MVKNYADEFLGALDKGFKKVNDPENEDETVAATAEEIIERANEITQIDKHTSNNDLTSSFQNSNDYVISAARTRLNAWAAHEGKTINWSTGTLNNSSRLVPLGNVENNSTIIMLIIVSMVGVTSIGACLYIRKKRSIN